MKYLKKFNMIKESKDRLPFEMVGNRELEPFIKHCGEMLTLPEDHFKHKEAIRILNDIIIQIDNRIIREEKLEQGIFSDEMEKMSYEVVKEIIEEKGELYYSADVLKGLKKLAEETLGNRGTKTDFSNFPKDPDTTFGPYKDSE